MALYFGLPTRRRYQSPMETLLGDLFDDISSPYASTYARPDALLQNIMMRPANSGTKKPWIHVFNMRGFTEKEVTVNINEDSVNIHAKHEEGDDGNIDKYEKLRSVKIPKDIDREKIACFLNSDGRFFVKGQYVKKEPQEIKAERITEGPETVQTEKKSEENAGSGEGAAVAKSEKSDKEPSKVKTLADFLLDALNLGEDYKNAAGDYAMIGDGNPHFGTELIVKDKSLAPMTDSQEIVEKDGNKLFQIKMNMGQFAPENVSIRCQDNIVYIDAKQEGETDGMYKLQEVHKQYAVPENCSSKQAKATISDKGIVCVNIPIVEKTEHVELPIAHE